MSDLLKLPPEPDEEYSSGDILENFMSGHPVVIEELMKVFHEMDAGYPLSIMAKNNEVETEKATDSCNENGQTTRESKEDVDQSPVECNLDQEVAHIPNDIVDNLKSGRSVNVKVLMKIFQYLSADGVLNILNDKTELQTGGKKPVMVREITYPVRQKICELLDTPRMLGNDFRTLGGEIGLSNEVMQLILRNKNPTYEVLKKWETQLVATVEAFKGTLQKMKRDDVVDVLEGNRKPDDECSPLMVRGMSYLVRMEICKMLNVRRDFEGDFKTLAGILGMSTRDISLISYERDPANEVITWWETQNSATIEAFEYKLREIGRSDIEEVIREASQHLNCVQKLSQIGEQMLHRRLFSLREIIVAFEALGILKKTEIGWSFIAENSAERRASRNIDVSNSGEENVYQEGILKMFIAVSSAAVGGLLVHAYHSMASMAIQ